jgi:hypothetical protein
VPAIFVFAGTAQAKKSFATRVRHQTTATKMLLDYFLLRLQRLGE